jgi:hypothetical protein
MHFIGTFKHKGIIKRARKNVQLVTEKLNHVNSQVLVPPACNPSYSGGRDQENCCSKAARNSSKDSISKKPITKMKQNKKTGGEAQGVGPEFKPQYHKIANMC